MSKENVNTETDKDICTLLKNKVLMLKNDIIYHQNDKILPTRSTYNDIIPQIVNEPLITPFP